MRKVAGSACVVLVGLGATISGWQSPPLGFVLIAAGVALGMISTLADGRLRRRIPHAIVRRSDLDATRAGGAAGARHDLDESLGEIESYLGRVGDLMERHGFGRTPPAAAPEGGAVPATAQSLSALLQEELRRGRQVQARAPITSEGASGPIEVWEQNVASLLEDAGRYDLVTRFEARTPGELARGLWSGRWETRARVDRKLQLVSQFIRELGGSS